MAEKTQETSSAALSMAERSERRSPPLPKVAPWLVIPYGKDRKNQAFYNLCDPDKRTCRKLIPELSGKSIFQKPCHHGWLVILCDFNAIDYSPNWVFADCFLWNPATLETIQLPNIHSSGYTYDEYKLVDCVLSLPPRSTNPSDGNDTMVFCVYERLDNECEYVFLFCRPGDKQWRTQKFTREKHKMGPNSIVSLNYLKGNLYAMSYSLFSHFKIEIEQIDGDNILCIRQIETSKPIGSSSIGGSYTSVRTIYVQTYDELYGIDLRFAHQGDEFISIDIMKLDFSTMGWKEVKNLGDTVLFYSKTTTACCSAAELGLTRGCLYYTLAKDQSLYKYELEGTGTILLPCLKLPTPWFCSNWIMMPPTFRVVDGLQRTKFMLDKSEEEDYIMNLGVKTTNLARSNENPEEIYTSEEVKQQTPWSILDQDSLHMVSSYLHPIDYKLLRSVCKANRLNLSLGKQRSTSNRIISNTGVSPWLLFSIMNDNTVYNLVDPMNNNENYFMERPMLRGAIIRFQKSGWLLMSEGSHKLFFHNPFTKETIQLPDFPEYYGLSNILFSSLPTCSDCVVFGIGESEETELGGIKVYIIRKGEKSWRYQDFCDIDTFEYYMPLLNTPVLHKGTLYCVDYNGLLGTFSLEDGISWSYKVLDKPYGTFDRTYPSFLVECGGDLLLVKLGRIGKFLKIFKLDFSKMEWVQVKSLRKYTLFISYTSCVSRMAPCTDMENKVYFPRLSLHGEGVLFYSLDTGSYQFLGNQNSSKDFIDTKGWSSWTWIEPNWSRSTIQELDWFTTLS